MPVGETLVSETLTNPEPTQPQRRIRVAVVLNGAAGALLTLPDALPATEALFAAAGLQAAFVAPDFGTLPARIAQARDSGAEAVVVGGGDGTIACAAAAMADSATPLGILPLGTMNLLAHDLGLPVGDLAAAIRVIAEGVERRIDVGTVNGHAFLCASMLGLPTRLARYREQRRGRMSTLVRAWRMAAATLRALWRERYELVSVSAGAAATTLRNVALTIAVNAYDTGTGRLFGRSTLDGGALALYGIRRLRLRDALRLAGRLALQSWQQDRQILQQSGPEIVVRTGRRAIRVMNDGEVMLLTPPLRYGVRPRALRVLVPPP